MEGGRVEGGRDVSVEVQSWRVREMDGFRPESENLRT